MKAFPLNQKLKDRIRTLGRRWERWLLREPRTTAEPISDWYHRTNTIVRAALETRYLDWDNYLEGQQLVLLGHIWRNQENNAAFSACNWRDSEWCQQQQNLPNFRDRVERKTKANVRHFCDIPKLLHRGAADWRCIALDRVLWKLYVREYLAAPLRSHHTNPRPTQSER